LHEENASAFDATDAEKQCKTRERRIKRVQDTMEYKHYLEKVPKESRTSDMPSTPRLNEPKGSRAWKYGLEGWQRWLRDQYGVREEDEDDLSRGLVKA
jgi:hypothetical protein